MAITSIILHRTFEKGYKKQKESIKTLFKEKRTLFLQNNLDPILNTHRLHGTWEGYWSINITGGVRAIYRTQGRTAIFVAIGSHSELYG